MPVPVVLNYHLSVDMSGENDGEGDMYYFVLSINILPMGLFHIILIDHGIMHGGINLDMTE